MIKNINKVLIILMIVTITIFAILPGISNATLEDPLKNPEAYDPANGTSSHQKLIEKGKILVGVIRAVGIVIAVITLMVIGLRYMFGSTAERANYKETMIPYLIGAVMLFTITNLLGIIYDLVTGIKME